MDITITVLQALVQLILGGLGVYVSMKPPSAEKHRILIAVFVILGLSGVGLTIAQQVRNSRTQQDLMQQLATIKKNTETPPSVTVNVPPSPPAQIILQGGNPFHGSLSLTKVEFPPSLDTDPFAVNIHLTNVGQAPVPDVHFWEMETFLPIGKIKSVADSNAADRKAYASFLKLGKKAIKESERTSHAPGYFAVGEDHWGTFFAHPRKEEIDGVISGSVRLYFFAYAEWDSGKSTYARCLWLQPPPAVNYGSGGNLVLHDCVW
jgi:hypothetical protein